MVSPRNDVWEIKPAQKFHTDNASLLADLGSTSDWSCRSWNLLQPIRSTTQIWVVTRHQCEISGLVSQTSFRGETVGGVTKCRLFSKATVGSRQNVFARRFSIISVFIFYLFIFLINLNILAWITSLNKIIRSWCRSRLSLQPWVSPDGSMGRRERALFDSKILLIYVTKEDFIRLSQMISGFFVHIYGQH